ncbi:MAG: RluA family pseudouridine synthase, partial [Flavobacteriaceae bacterium]|nr:RluA family pseudouridine synthase [Flavobacteriaceae bacterium]
QIRKHGEFYPACRSKCEALLGHMLQGLKVEENPIENSLLERKKIQLIFEDEHLAVILKPHELLSVPGKRTKFSVLTQLKDLYPDATGPLLVHRLDMSTSGIMLMAKSDVVHKQLQAQFIQRKVKKTYQALLEGELVENQGEVKLPLRVDLDNRPHQMVCHQHGKPAHTKWKKIEVKAGKTLVEFYPITGRTHQLRVHAAHPHGLNLPIVGDDLYGKPANRLHLHAASLSFQHPVIKEFMNFEERAEF